MFHFGVCVCVCVHRAKVTLQVAASVVLVARNVPHCVETATEPSAHDTNEFLQSSLSNYISTVHTCLANALLLCVVD